MSLGSKSLLVENHSSRIYHFFSPCCGGKTGLGVGGWRQRQTAPAAAVGWRPRHPLGPGFHCHTRGSVWWAEALEALGIESRLQPWPKPGGDFQPMPIGCTTSQCQNLGWKNGLYDFFLFVYWFCFVLHRNNDRPQVKALFLDVCIHCSPPPHPWLPSLILASPTWNLLREIWGVLSTPCCVIKITELKNDNCGCWWMCSFDCISHYTVYTYLISLYISNVFNFCLSIVPQ